MTSTGVAAMAPFQIIVMANTIQRKMRTNRSCADQRIEYSGVRYDSVRRTLSDNRPRALGLKALGFRKHHADRGADAKLARHADFPAEAVGQPLDDREADAVAAAATLIAPEKRNERAREFLLVHADAGVAHDDAVRFDADRHTAALGVLAGIADQVADE